MHSNGAMGTLAPQALSAWIPKAVEQTISVSEHTSDKSDSQEPLLVDNGGSTVNAATVSWTIFTTDANAIYQI